MFWWSCEGHVTQDDEQRECLLLENPSNTTSVRMEISNQALLDAGVGDRDTLTFVLHSFFPSQSEVAEPRRVSFAPSLMPLYPSHMCFMHLPCLLILNSRSRDAFQNVLFGTPKA